MIAIQNRISNSMKKEGGVFVDQRSMSIIRCGNRASLASAISSKQLSLKLTLLSTTQNINSRTVQMDYHRSEFSRENRTPSNQPCDFAL